MIEPIKIVASTDIIKNSYEDRVKKAIKGDKKAYSEIILGMEQKLYRVSRSVLRDDADCADAIQEALIRAWLKLPSLRSHELFEHWLIRILLRECYRIAKQTKYYPLETNQIGHETQPDFSQRILLEEAVYSLKIEQRSPFVLHHMMGYKVYETAKILDIPEGTVKSSLMRARNKLKNILQEERK